MNRDVSTTPLAALAYVLVGSLAGFGLANLIRPPAATPTPVGLSSDGGSDDRSPQLDAILKELRTLSERLEDAGARPRRAAPRVADPLDPADGSARVPLAAGDTDQAELVAALQALVRRLDTVGAAAPDLSRPAPDASRDHFAAYDPASGAGADQVLAEKRLQRDHFLWSYAQLLDRYGKPDHITVMPGGELYWMYEFEDGRMRNFTFADGRVIRADL